MPADSQMSAAFFNKLEDPAKRRPVSGGTQPTENVHPALVDVMREVGIDLSEAKSQNLLSS